MKTIWYRVTRLLHPITLAVILIGVAGFLLGLIVAVERQDVAVVAPKVDVVQVDRIARLESTLADRESELAALQAELTRQRVNKPSPTVIANAERRIAGLEAALTDSTAELNALQNELTELAGQLAEAIQTRDELRLQNAQVRRDNETVRAQNEQVRRDSATERAQNERARVDIENERASLERTIADLLQKLETAQELARAPAPVVATTQDDSPPEDAPSEDLPFTAAEAPAPEPTAAASASAEPAETSVEETSPARPSRPEASEPEQQTAAAPASVGPISQGIAAYRAADYRKAYELWLPPALKGSTRAQFYVGALHFEGRGVPADRVLAYMWLRAATKRDDPGAIKLLDRVREGMTGPELAEAEIRIANGEDFPSE